MATKTVFVLQLLCCGGDSGPSDWENNIYFNCSSSIEYNGKQLTPAEACGVPYSCCIKSVAGGVADTQCGYNVRKLDVSCILFHQLIPLLLNRGTVSRKKSKNVTCECVLHALQKSRFS